MKATRWVLPTVVVVISSIYFLRCDSLHTPTQPNTIHSVDEWTDITASNKKSGNSEETHCEVVKKINYKGSGILKIDDVFTLRIHTKSMSTGKDTEIFAEVDLMADGSLRFHFEPCGLEFDPPAQLELHWQKMDVNDDDILKLYFLQTEGRKELISDMNDTSGPYLWNRYGKHVIFQVPHFSLYSLSRD